jgi:hypothetical protein
VSLEDRVGAGISSSTLMTREVESTLGDARNLIAALAEVDSSSSDTVCTWSS